MIYVAYMYGLDCPFFLFLYRFLLLNRVNRDCEALITYRPDPKLSRDNVHLIFTNDRFGGYARWMVGGGDYVLIATAFPRPPTHICRFLAAEGSWPFAPRCPRTCGAIARVCVCRCNHPTCVHMSCATCVYFYEHGYWSLCSRRPRRRTVLFVICLYECCT